MMVLLMFLPHYFPPLLHYIRLNTLNKVQSTNKLHCVNTHFFTLLHMVNNNACYIADGQNAFLKERNMRRIILAKLVGAKSVECLPFRGQLGSDHCGSSAVAIAIGFQFAEKDNKIPQEIRVASSTLTRLRNAMHKRPSASIKKWTKISEINWKVVREKYGRKFNSKNKSILNLHKC